MKVTPAVTVHLPFGGDNHNDAELTDEATQTSSSIGNIEFLWNELKSAGLQDQVTFALFNVFGRTLKRNARGGRDHNGNHHAMMLFGHKLRGSVIGGIAADSRDFSATAIDSATGAGAERGHPTARIPRVSGQDFGGGARLVGGHARPAHSRRQSHLRRVGLKSKLLEPQRATGSRWPAVEPRGQSDSAGDSW